MNWWLIIVLPLISACIGWTINWVAIKMLFHPNKPVRFLGITIQGVYPKRQQQFAGQLGKLVSNELISFDEIEAKITSPEILKKIMPVVEVHIDEFLRHKLKTAFPMIGMFIGEKTINQLKGIFMNELETIFPVLMRNYVKNLLQEYDVEKLVAEKLSAFPDDKLETILSENILNKFRMVGFVSGLLIGLIQVLIMYLAG
jgi:uncharacterized membrane protein YheB (UPF0754 family)